MRFTVDGVELDAQPGDTVAAALLRNGRIRVGDSIYRGRPRGIVAAGVEEPNALIRIEPTPGVWPSAMVPATVMPVQDGMVVTLLSGLGALSEGNVKPADKRFAHTDVLIVGAGPAGLAAALVAARSGARVTVVDEQPVLGGSLLASSTEQIEGMSARDWVGIVAAELAALPEVTVLTSTTAFGSYDSNYVLAHQRRDDLERLHHLRARQVVLATGAHERPLVFAGNDVPGVMLAGAVRTYLNRFGVLAGRSVVVATTNSSADLLVTDLERAGASVTVLDARTGAYVVSTAGTERIISVTTSTGATIPCDLLAVSGGWSPVTHLWTQRQGTTTWDDALAAFVPAGAVRDQAIIGSANGTFDLDGCLWEGARAGASAATATGFAATAPTFRADSGPAGDPAIAQLWSVDGDPDEMFVDLQRDQTVADVRAATGAGLRSVEHVKRYTSIGTAHDQGKTAGLVTGAVVASEIGTLVAEVGVSNSRAPYTPVSFGTLAGRETGALFDVERTTPIHPWHVEHGAVFEIVGQWQRPWYYPRTTPDGVESMDDAVLREGRAVRTGVGMQDASTLGKIEVRGADAGEFLNRVYTNAFKKLPVGSARYGVMCQPDGMMWDDGVTLRLADDRYFMTTTTGNAAAVLDHLEDFLQTEWPDLDVTLTSVTEQWSTIAVAGPRSRDVIAAIAPDLDVSTEAFGFMTFRETTLSSGASARICRVSFSGELAFEVNVSGWDGLATWELIAAAGEPFGITPYGTETMHVLRAEKGFAIVGQDTDGTVTPQDAGMDWIVSKVKPFIGSRSHARADAQRPDRRQLVGVLPAVRVAEGTQLVAAGQDLSAPPVPMLGWVTSSYHSPALDRPFGLALIASGRERIGTTVAAVVGGALIDVEIVPPVFYDPEGARRDGEPGSAAGSPAARPQPSAPAALSHLDGPPARLRPSALPAHSSDDARDGARRLGRAEVTSLRAAQVSVRAEAGGPMHAAVESVLGFALPTAVGETTTDGTWTALWLAPDEFLLCGPIVAPGATVPERVARLTLLSQEQQSVRGLVVDVSAQRPVVELSGPDARDLLEGGCPVDLHPRAFGSGNAVATTLARIPLILWQSGESSYRLLPRTSFADYVVRWLTSAH